MSDEIRATATKAGLNLDDVKKGISRLLPIIEPIAKLTPNKYDDALVAFLKAVLADSA